MPVIKIALIISRFNESVTRRLLQECLSELKKNAINDSQIVTSWVPGALELPVTALGYAQRKNISAVICLGAVIRGDTYHFELVAQECARGIVDVSLRTGKPIIFGVLSTNTVKQANERSMVNGGDNKGRDAAQAALQMIDVLAHIKKDRK